MFRKINKRYSHFIAIILCLAMSVVVFPFYGMLHNHASAVGLSVNTESSVISLSKDLSDDSDFCIACQITKYIQNFFLKTDILSIQFQHIVVISSLLVSITVYSFISRAKDRAPPVTYCL